jgi:hypothetical protein
MARELERRFAGRIVDAIAAIRFEQIGLRFCRIASPRKTMIMPGPSSVSRPDILAASDSWGTTATGLVTRTALNQLRGPHAPDFPVRSPSFSDCTLGRKTGYW